MKIIQNNSDLRWEFYYNVCGAILDIVTTNQGALTLTRPCRLKLEITYSKVFKSMQAYLRVEYEKIIGEHFSQTYTGYTISNILRS